MSGLRFSHLSSVAQMLSFTACSKTMAKYTAVGSKCRNLMLGEKVQGGFERAFEAFVVVRLCLKFNRDSVLRLMWNLRCGSPW